MYSFVSAFFLSEYLFRDSWMLLNTLILITFYWQVVFHCMTVLRFCLFTYLLMNVWVVSGVGLLNKADIDFFVPLCTSCFMDIHLHFYWQNISRNGMIRSFHKYVVKFIRNHQTTFQNGCTVSPSFSSTSARQPLCLPANTWYSQCFSF